MAIVRKSMLLEFEKSDFLVELKEHVVGDLYISVTQTIRSTNQTDQMLRISPAYLKKLTEVMNMLCLDALKEPVLISHRLKQKDFEYIVVNYLKGLPIESLALIMDVTADDIKEVLRDRDIPVLDQSPRVHSNRGKHRRSRY